MCRLVTGIVLLVFGFLPLGGSWHFIQGAAILMGLAAIVSVPIGRLLQMIDGDNLPESFEDAFGFDIDYHDERRVDAQD